MSRARLVDTVLAATATLLVIVPINTLVAPDTWQRPAVIMIGSVSVAGAIGRMMWRSPLAILLGQLVTGTVVSGLLYGQGHLWYGLPTLDSFHAVGILLGEGIDTIQRFAPPAPASRGITLGIGLVAGLTALVVDVLAVTLRRPALAGAALFGAYLIPVANSGEGMPVVYFILPTVVWLVLVARAGIAGVRQWSTLTPRSTRVPTTDHDDDESISYAALGRLLGVAALALALVIPATLPHLPTRFLLDGLGRGPAAAGQGSGEMSLSSTVNIAQDLASQSGEPVLRYRTDAAASEPLRVGILTTYRDGVWAGAPGPGQVPSEPGILPEYEQRGAADEFRTMTVTENRVAAPQLAAPYPVVAADLGEASWQINSARDILVRTAPTEYEISYLERDPWSEDSGALPDVELRNDDPESIDVPRSAVPALRDALDALDLPTDRLGQAQAIQAWLRSDEFTYSLELAGPLVDPSGRPVRLDPISHFLTTKRGYCTQFATSMVMMARVAGIPARFAVGFLPGTSANGEYTVRRSDAHAWPELWFDGVGWVRFEATPATRSGSAPGYSIGSTPLSTATTAPTSSATSSSATRPDRLDELGGLEQGSNTTTNLTLAERISQWSFSTWLILAIIIGLLGSLTVPAAAWLRRWRATRHADDDISRVEAEWTSMLSRIDDLGIRPPPGATPRQTHAWLTRTAYLDGADGESLGRVVRTIERARYARPGTESLDIAHDAHRVVTAVSHTRQRRTRARALFFPSQGLEQWRDVRDGLLAMPRRAWRRLRERD